MCSTLRAAAAPRLRSLREIAGDDDPTLTVEKHKVVQILINLVRNARQACAERGLGLDASGRVVARRAAPFSEPMASTSRCATTAYGIAPPEILARVFEHRLHDAAEDGHGFGLHGAALRRRRSSAARWPSRARARACGATFTLDLPLVAARASAPRERMKVA